MISTCPDCDTPLRSNICPCGYRLPDEAPAMPDYTPEYVAPVKRGMNWRERWFAERNLPYEPAKLVDCPPFRCIGGSAGRFVREPGSDC
jgi:hypothetical protein